MKCDHRSCWIGDDLSRIICATEGLIYQNIIIPFIYFHPIISNIKFIICIEYIYVDLYRNNGRSQSLWTRQYQLILPADIARRLTGNFIFNVEVNHPQLNKLVKTKTYCNVPIKVVAIFIRILMMTDDFVSGTEHLITWNDHS